MSKLDSRLLQLSSRIDARWSELSNDEDKQVALYDKDTPDNLGMDVYNLLDTLVTETVIDTDTTKKIDSSQILTCTEEILLVRALNWYIVSEKNLAEYGLTPKEGKLIGKICNKLNIDVPVDWRESGVGK